MMKQQTHRLVASNHRHSLALTSVAVVMINISPPDMALRRTTCSADVNFLYLLLLLFNGPSIFTKFSG